MKNVCLILTLLCFFEIVNSQDFTGKYFIGGSLGFSNNSGSANIYGTNYTNPNAFSSFSINPFFGFYIKPKIAIGLQLGYSSNTSNQLIISANTDSTTIQGTFKNTFVTYSITPFLRYTIPVIEKIGFNINFSIPYSYNKSTAPGSSGITAGITTAYIGIPYNNSISTSFIGLNISPGFQWFVKDNIALLGSFGGLGYNYFYTKGENNTGPASTAKGNYFNLTLSSAISLGVNFYFGKKV